MTLCWKMTVLVLTACCVLTGCKDRPDINNSVVLDPAARAKLEWEAQAALAESAKKASCIADKVAILASYGLHMSDKNFTKANLTVRACASLTADADFLRLTAESQAAEDRVEVLRLLKEMSDKHLPVSTNLSAYEKLTREYSHTEAFKLVEKDVQRYKKTYETYAKIRAESKRHAAMPLVGSTKQALLDLKGHPSRMNRTVTGAGKTEQWIYCLYDDLKDCKYIYLKNDVVTAYQE